MNNAKKIGRKQKHWTDTRTGKPVEGLTRRPDGRWRIIGTHTTFREPDELKAIAKFRELTSQHFPPLSAEEEKKLDVGIKKRTIEVSDNIKALVQRAQSDDNCSLVIIPSKLPLWEYFAHEITTRPKWVAEQCGIEKLGYLTDLKPPETLPTFDELGKLWEKHAACSVEQMKKVRTGWDHFVETTGATTLSEITLQATPEQRQALEDAGSGLFERLTGHKLGKGDPVQRGKFLKSMPTAEAEMEWLRKNMLYSNAPEDIGSAEKNIPIFDKAEEAIRAVSPPEETPTYLPSRTGGVKPRGSSKPGSTVPATQPTSINYNIRQYNYGYTPGSIAAPESYPTRMG